MTVSTAARSESRTQFFLRTAKAWQNYFDAEGLLPGIDPSDEQKVIIQQEEDQLLINGSAGSGKSITLMYKLLKVMKQEQEPRRILYVTFNKTLLDDTIKRLKTSEKYRELTQKHHLDLFTFHWLAYQLLKEMKVAHVKPVDTSLRGIKRLNDRLYRRIESIKENLMNSAEYKKMPVEQRLYNTHTAGFIGDEIMWMKANGIVREESYLQVERTGRSQNPRLTRQQRKTLFRIFEIYQERMKKDYNHDMDLEDYALNLLRIMDRLPDALRYDYVLVDEVQDLQPMQILALVKLTKKGIVLTGDPKQRIYKSTPHTYSSLGLNLTGRKIRTLRQNFRSTRQIMSLAESLTFQDVENDRLDHLVFVREGEKPVISYHLELRKLADDIVKQIRSIHEQNPAASIAIIHRYDEELNRGVPNSLERYLKQRFSLISTDEYNRKFDYQSEKKPVFFTDVYSIKGLEFDHVFVIHFDRNHYPMKKRIQELNKCAENQFSDGYKKDLDKILSDEKKLLYVALTRAKHTLRIMYYGSKPESISPFVRDFRTEDYEAVGFDKNKYTRKN